MTLGIAVPTYSGHLYNLNNLLHQITKSTILPRQVSISISSFDGELKLDDYPFELIISKTSEYKNPSQNRNIAASKLMTDIISFIDGDDIPHLKRNEYLLKSFDNGCKIVVHNYKQINNINDIKFDDIGEFELLKDYIDDYLSEFHHPVSKIKHLDYHCAHISLLNKIFKKFDYNEDEKIKYREDSEFNSRLVKNGFKISYIHNKLSYYLK